jgi:hypothetical protein
MAPLAPFYGCLSLAFAALAAFWFARHWREAAPLQSCGAALVVALGMAEAATWHFDLAEFGAAARWRCSWPRVAAWCGPRWRGWARVVGFEAAFFVAAEALEVAENVGAVSDRSPSPTGRMFLALPVAALNAVFVYWTFSSLSRTLSKLKVSDSSRAIHSACFVYNSSRGSYAQTSRLRNRFVSIGETDDAGAGDVPEIHQRLDHWSGLVARLDGICGKTPTAGSWIIVHVPSRSLVSLNCTCLLLLSVETSLDCACPFVCVWSNQSAAKCLSKTSSPLLFASAMNQLRTCHVRKRDTELASLNRKRFRDSHGYWSDREHLFRGKNCPVPLI